MSLSRYFVFSLLRFFDSFSLPRSAQRDASHLKNRGGVGGGASLNHKPSTLNHKPSTLNSQLTALAIDPSLLSLEASKISGGQRQRILLAAALALPKPLLLLDEPTSALDEENSQRVALALLRACHEEGRAALVVSHDPVFLRFCDKVITLP